jgi:hypothetical protein
MHDYVNSVNPFPPATITPRQIVEQINVAEAERVDRHVSNQPTDDVDRLLRALRAAAVNGEFLVEIGEVGR